MEAEGHLVDGDEGVSNSELIQDSRTSVCINE